jgi:Pvc16 N-terminal domain
MPTPPSSLSVAIQAVADYLDGLLDEDVVVTVDSPQRAQETAKASSNDILNVFVYRIAPSAFYAGLTSQDPFFVQANVLMTAFPRGQGADAPQDIDLRILGQVIRILQSAPVIPLPSNAENPQPPLPGAAPAGATDDFRLGPHLDYRLQAVLQAPGMEELNHIWTTQGGELAYRLSAAYEFALIPIEPLVHRVEAPPARSGIVDVRASVPRQPPAGFLEYGAEQITRALAGETEGSEPPVPWVPLQLFVVGDSLANARSVAPATGSVPVRLSGPLGERVTIEVRWTRSGGGSETQAAQPFDILVQRIDDAAGEVTVTLANPQDGDAATILSFPALADGTPVAGAPPGNALSLTVTL